MILRKPLEFVLHCRRLKNETSFILGHILMHSVFVLHATTLIAYTSLSLNFNSLRPTSATVSTDIFLNFLLS